MKKMTAFVFALVCVLALAGCRPDGTPELIGLGEVSDLVLEKGYTAEDLKERLLGQWNKDIIRAWGEPDVLFSGFWGNAWYLNDSKDDAIALYYDADGYVEEIAINHSAPAETDPNSMN